MKSQLIVRLSSRKTNSSAAPVHGNRQVWKVNSLSALPLTFQCATAWAERLYREAEEDGGGLCAWESTHLTVLQIVVQSGSETYEHVITGDLNGSQYSLLKRYMNRFFNKVPSQFLSSDALEDREMWLFIPFEFYKLGDRE